MGPEHRRRRIEPCQAIEQFRLCAVGEVGFRQHQAVGQGDLFDRNLLAIERAGAVHGVDRRDHAAERQATGNASVGHQGLQDRRRIREPAGFDDDAIELGKRAAVAAAEHVRERFC